MKIIIFFVVVQQATISGNDTEINFLDIPTIILERALSNSTIIDVTFGKTQWEKTILMNCLILRISLTFIFFFLLAVAERTFKQKYKKKNIFNFYFNKNSNCL